ncbi:MAG: SDR family NAD(P)-dependent oxidoreductase [Calditrichaeota bacterium]|nr:MAG: SDR family NAD(P)-dependent oxidoreductase [Calditrichota bacterium]
MRFAVGFTRRWHGSGNLWLIILVSKNNQQKILITGATGLVGTHLLYACDPENVVGTYYTVKPAVDNYSYYYLDLQYPNSIHTLISEIEPTHIIHCAAKSSLDWCEKNKYENWRINAEAPILFAQICAQNHIRYLFISSDMVFDGSDGFYSETDATNPLSLYGKAKLAAESGIQKINPHAVIARIALVYGLPLAPDRGSSFLTWILSRIHKNQTVPLFKDQFRTPISVNELVSLLFELLFSDYCGIVHVGGPERLNRLQFGKYVCQAFELGEKHLIESQLCEIEQIPARPRDLSLTIDKLNSIVETKQLPCLKNLEYWAAVSNRVA